MILEEHQLSSCNDVRMYWTILSILFFNIILPTLDTLSDLSLVIDLYRGVPPCGINAVCTQRSCQCIPDYIGDPYVACRPECTVNKDCPSTKTCQHLHCVDPYPNAHCGYNAQCQVVNHIPNCVCLSGYIGDPFTACRLPPKRKF